VRMRSMILAAMVMMLAGCAPAGIARSSCESILLATGDPWSCTVTGDVVRNYNSIAFSTESRNQVARVSIVLRVTRGTLRVGYRDLTGEQQLLVTPSEPANLEMQTRMHRERRSFSISFEPVNGAVEGLSGTVKYLTP
jgi:hypothetical protein